ncbi:hypothetical protein [Lysinibacillus endophyticus]|uniref:hypothetical protein n=1 Tax=Ureibacillus endophyticus TaxID=1978490 RepID=UPI0020A15DE7|nr:hypothetical protein [Lysinibacillus endophyticus]MCP1144138.1 hypothetical protein [Lysinibacillus endophyticus]
MDGTVEKKHSVNEEIADLKISIVIISSTVVLPIQFLILFSLNLYETSIGNAIQLFSKGIVAVLFLFTLPIILKKNMMKLIVVYFLGTFIFFLQFIIFPENRNYLIELIFPLFFMCLPVFIYTVTLKNWAVLKKVMEQASIIIFIACAIMGIQVILGTASIGTYSMTFSYYLLLPVVISLNELIERFRLLPFIITMLSILLILLIGSRGPLLCIAVFIILKLIRPGVSIATSKMRIFSYFTLIMLILFFCINYKNIILVINYNLLKFGFYSRSINLFLSNEIYLSGRDEIYEMIVQNIVNNPFLGIGIAGDRRVADGVYAHNIMIEFFANFGVIIGTILITALLFKMTKLLFSKDINVYNMMILWISMGFIELLVSGSYLTHIPFWILLGLIINKTILQKS